MASQVAGLRKSLKSVSSLGRPTKDDALAAVTTGVANVPDGMASAVLAGVNPVYGIYTLMVGTPVAALGVSTQMMMFNTTSAMTLVAVDGLGTRSGDDRVAALIVIALVAGIFQLALGLLGLGMLTKFVSNAVMIGFLTGIAMLIILGQLWDLTGYEGEGGSKLEQAAQLLANLRDVDPPTTVIGLGTLALMLLLMKTPVRSFNLLIGLGVATLATAIIDRDSIALVSSLGDIPRSLPQFDVPQFSLMPKMALAGIAVGTVGLLQAAGVAQAYPNPDGTPTSDSADFRGQGVANISNSFFNAMPGGGSLSGTALNVSAGARSRWALIIQAVVVLIVVLVFSNLLSKIPMAALAALLVYSAALSIKWAAITTIRRTSTVALVSMAATFFATLVVPLQQAVVLGVVLAAVLFIYRASTDVRLMKLNVDDGRLTVSDPPKQFPSNEVTVLDVVGNLFYAGVRTLQQKLPTVGDSERPVVVLRIRGQSDVGSTFFKVVGGLAEDLRSRGGHLVVAGVDPLVNDRMKSGGLLDVIGEDSVFLAGSVIGESTAEALRAGEAWLAGEQGALRSPDGLAGAPQDTFTDSADDEPISSVVAAAESKPPLVGDLIQEPEPIASTPSETSAIGVNEHTVVWGWIGPRLQRILRNPDRSAWTFALAAGVLLAILGVTAILATENFGNALRLLIGATLAVVAGAWILATRRMSGVEPALSGQLRMLSAGSFLIGAAALFIETFTKALSPSGALAVAGLSLVVAAAAGLAAALRLPADLDARRTGTAAGISQAVVGLLLLVETRNGSSNLETMGWVAVSAGIGLAAHGLFLRFSNRRNDQEIIEDTMDS